MRPLVVLLRELNATDLSAVTIRHEKGAGWVASCRSGETWKSITLSEDEVWAVLRERAPRSKRRRE